MKSRLSVSLGFVLLALASATLTGCPQGSDLEGEDRFSGAGASGGSAGSAGSGSGGGANDCLQCDVQSLLKASCLGVGCHGSSAFVGSLDLESPDAESRLLNVPAWAARADEVSDPEACDLTEMRVDGNDPSKSVLLEKIMGTQSCGLKMPVGPKLSDTQIDCFRRWSYCMAGKDPDSATGSGGTGSGGTAGTGGTSSGGTAGTGGTSSGGTAGSGGGQSAGGSGGSTGGSGGAAP